MEIIRKNWSLKYLILFFLLGFSAYSPFIAISHGSDTENETVRRHDERLFHEGLDALSTNDYQRARSKFKNLISNYRNSPRVKDALYFLDWIRLRDPTTQSIPTIRTRLDKGKKIKGSSTGKVRVENNYGEEITIINKDESWEALNRGETLLFKIGSRDRYRVDQIRLIGTDRGYLTFNGRPYRGVFELTRANQKVQLINELPMNHYLYGVVRKEIAPGWPMSTIKAQAVAARSFAVYRMNKTKKSFDLKSTGLAQVYGGVEAETKRIKQAVRETQGQVITHGGRVVPTFFHANSGGYIETAEKIWEGSKTPHIVPKPDTWSQNVQHYQWSNRISYNSLNDSLRAADYPAMKPGTIPRINQKLPSGRAVSLTYETMNAHDKSISAEDLRLAAGSETIKSSWLTNISEQNGKLHFEGRGWGHGIGMSQWGAKNMAESGKNYRRILSFYYENGSLTGQYGPSTVNPDMVSNP